MSFWIFGMRMDFGQMMAFGDEFEADLNWNDRSFGFGVLVNTCFE
jgi:hypothetical protein